MQFEHPYVVFAAAAAIVGVTLLARRSPNRRRGYAFFGALAGALCMLSLGRPFTTDTGWEMRRIEWVVDLTAPMRWPDRPADAEALKNLMAGAGEPQPGSFVAFDEAGVLRLDAHQLDDRLHGHRPENGHTPGDASRARMLAAAMEMADDDCDVAIISDATLASPAVSGVLARLRERSGSVHLVELLPLKREESDFHVRIECPERVREGEPVEIAGEVLSSPNETFAAVLRAGAADPVQKEVVTDAYGRAHIAMAERTFPPGEHLVQLEAESPQGALHTAAAVLSVRPRARIVSLGSRDALDPVGAILQAEGYAITSADVATDALGRADVVLAELSALETMADAPLERLAHAVAREGMGLVVLSSSARDATTAPGLTLASLLPVDIIAEPSPPEPEPEPEPEPPAPPPPEPEKELPKPEKKPRKVPRPSFAVVAVIDKSGSMDGDKLRLAQLAVVAITHTIHDEDALGVLAFDIVPKWIFRPRRAFRYLDLDAALKEMSAGGGTDIYRALEEAYAEIRKLNTNVKHVILATDGRTELADFKGLIEKMTADDITVSTVAIGTEADHNLLARISAWGGGGFYFTSSYREIPQIFTVDARRFMPVESEEEEPEEPETAPEEEDKPPEEDEVDKPVVAEAEAPSPEKKPESPAEERAKKTYRLLKVEDLQVIAGIPEEELPVLAGRTVAREKTLSAVALADDGGTPVLVVGRAGLGRVVYWGSDAGGDWSPGLLQWPFASKLFSQLVNAASALSGIRETAIAARVMRQKDGIEVIAVVYPSVAGDGESFEMSARLAGEDTSCEVRRLERRVFRIRAPAAQPGRQNVLQLDLRSSKGRTATAMVVLADSEMLEEDVRTDTLRARDVRTELLGAAAVERSARPIERRRDLSPFALLAALGFFVLALTEARRTGVIG